MRPKRKVTEDQKTKLLEMVRLDRWSMARFKDPAYHAQKVRWWNKAGAILNSIHGGALKTPKQWEKTFKDLRLAVKKKEVAFRNTTEPPDGMTKESFHQKMLELMDNELIGDDNMDGKDDPCETFNGQHNASTNFDSEPHIFSYPYSVPDIPNQSRLRRKSSLADENLDECRTFLQNKIAGLERIAKAQEDILASDRRNAASFEKLIGAVTRYLDRHAT